MVSEADDINVEQQKLFERLHRLREVFGNAAAGPVSLLKRFCIASPTMISFLEGRYMHMLPAVWPGT